jgi:hypothetical protein
MSIVRVSGADTAVACTIAGGIATTCANTVNSVAVAAGATMSIRDGSTSNPTDRRMRWTARFAQ